MPATATHWAATISWPSPTASRPWPAARQPESATGSPPPGTAWATSTTSSATTSAITCYERSLSLCRELADRYNEADTLDHLGRVHHSAGDSGAARWAWTQALRIFDAIDHPGGGPVRARLRLRGERPAAAPLSQPAEHRAAALATQPVCG